ncbi:peptide/nickel transport system permease protein [Peptoniphilus asaccharolyticus DSM 20463]|uniref:Peptide/nickel transport system permease protein n=1 Tax=Peptoniphilus asaccharolyticus DSM 20463 TaxID=573058 RepID=A0A1W1V5M9_PEPAS|nr:ABC transporter permease [Peptoniphilus asaccharolyticus]SMB88603.1 peptide/nickel transport system permease protein [Peptoniphilus asaccharolyticus DSM 20463]
MQKIIRRILLFFTLILFISFISFVLIDFSPIDPIASFARSRAIGLTPAEKQALILKWGLDKSLLGRYFIWLKLLLKGNLGVSNIYNRPVLEIIKRGFSASLLLMSCAWVLQGVVGITLGIIAGANIGSLKDKLIKLYALIFAATPAFWIGLMLIVIFSLKLNWFPASMGAPIGVRAEDVSFLQKLKHMILPCMSLVVVGVSNLILQTRTKVEDILNSDYVLYARAKGLKKKEIVSKYALKNMLLPGLTLQFAYFSELFSGTVLVENVFNYPGLGNLTVEAGLRGDMPLLLGLVVFSSVFVYAGNRICDVLYLFIDPRLRRKSGK